VFLERTKRAKKIGSLLAKLMKEKISVCFELRHLVLEIIISVSFSFKRVD